MTDLVMSPRVCLTNRHSRDATAEAVCTGCVYHFVFMRNSGLSSSMPRCGVVRRAFVGSPAFLRCCSAGGPKKRTERAANAGRGVDSGESDQVALPPAGGGHD